MLRTLSSGVDPGTQRPGTSLDDDEPGDGGTTVIEFSDPGDTGIPEDSKIAAGFVEDRSPG